VHTVEGNILYEKVSNPLGEPENPLPDSVTREKFRDAAGSFLSTKTMDKIESILDVPGPAELPQSLFEAVSESKHVI
jgi:hypothetical protein